MIVSLILGAATGFIFLLIYFILDNKKWKSYEKIYENINIKTDKTIENLEGILKNKDK